MQATETHSFNILPATCQNVWERHFDDVFCYYTNCPTGTWLLFQHINSLHPKTNVHDGTLNENFRLPDSWTHLIQRNRFSQHYFCQSLDRWISTHADQYLKFTSHHLFQSKEKRHHITMLTEQRTRIRQPFWLKKKKKIISTLAMLTSSLNWLWQRNSSRNTIRASLTGGPRRIFQITTIPKIKLNK